MMYINDLYIFTSVQDSVYKITITYPNGNIVKITKTGELIQYQLKYYYTDISTMFDINIDSLDRILNEVMNNLAVV